MPPKRSKRQAAPRPSRPTPLGPPPPPAPPPGARRTALWLLVPLALTLLAYWRAMEGEFQFDDTHTVERNLQMKDLGAFLRHDFIDNYFATGRPLTDLTFSLNYAVGRLAPWNFHFTSLLIHLGVVVLVWALSRTVLRLAGAARAEWTAVAVAGVFSLHPMQTQAVAYISQRAEVLASGFYVAAVLVLLAAERRAASKGWPLVAAGFALFVVGMAAKSIVITLPAAWLLLASLVPSKAERARRWTEPTRWLASAPFFLFAAYYASRTMKALSGHADAGFGVEGLTAWSYFFSQWRVLVIYLRLLIWPAGQNVDWDMPPAHSLFEPQVLVSGLLLLVLVGLAIWLVWAGRRREDADGAAMRLAGAGLLWFFVVLSVTSSFVPLADLVMEHRVYLACWGPFLAVAVGLERALARWRAPAAGPVAAALVALLWASPALATWQRNAVWETQRALWTDAVAKRPDNARAWLSLAHGAMMEGNLEESVRLNQEALKHADRVEMKLQIIRNLGAGQLLLGRPREAEKTLRYGVQLGQWDADLLNNLAATLAELGNLEEAEGYARRATQVSPMKSEGWATLADIAMRRGDPATALPLFEHSLALDPDVVLRHYNRAVALLRLGRSAEACATFRRIAGTKEATRDPQLRSRLGVALQDPACVGH